MLAASTSMMNERAISLHCLF